MQLSVKRLSETAKLPTKAYPSDAGWDVYANEDVTILPGQTVKVSTGIAVQLPQIVHSGYETVANIVWDRSSLGSKGIHRLAGILDFAYNGEIFVVLTNLNVYPILNILALYAGDKECLNRYDDIMEEYAYIIKKGDKIAQVLTQKILKCEIIEVDELVETDRGSNCLGSSDLQKCSS